VPFLTRTKLAPDPTRSRPPPLSTIRVFPSLFLVDRRFRKYPSLSLISFLFAQDVLTGTRDPHPFFLDYGAANRYCFRFSVAGPKSTELLDPTPQPGLNTYAGGPTPFSLKHACSAATVRTGQLYLCFSLFLRAESRHAVCVFLGRSPKRAHHCSSCAGRTHNLRACSFFSDRPTIYPSVLREDQGCGVYV